MIAEVCCNYVWRIMAYDTRSETHSVIAYGFAQTFTTLATDWMSFPQHYLLYASSGAFRLDIEQTRWFLPPQRAAWIAADVRFRVSITAPVTCASVLFAKDAIAEPPLPCQVFTVSPLVREMFLYAMRWGSDRSSTDIQADRFFLTLATLCGELASIPDNSWLPRGHSPELIRAIEYTLAHLGEQLRFVDVVHVAGVSERTLARRFVDETHMTWRAFVHRARMIMAMELLAAGQTTVTETVYATGFESLSAFSQAFRRFSGKNPSEYRQKFQQR